MKYILVLCDGMADYKISEINNSTPLSVAKTPYMDLLCKSGKIGLVKTIADGYKPGSDVANLGVLGYKASESYTGRSPLEALSIGINMDEDDLAIRANLVTLSDDSAFEDKKMVDYSSSEISTNEARELIEYINSKLGNEKFNFYTGVSYRHCLIVKHTKPNEILTPPHDITGKVISTHLPKGIIGEELTNLIKKSYELLKDHPINVARKQKGLNPANALWFWGEGTKPNLKSFSEKYNKSGAMISAVDLLKGIAIGAKMKSLDVPGATGTIKTNFEGKADAAIKILNDVDFVFIHLEAPDECGHQGNLKDKIRSIELIDEKIIGKIVNTFKEKNEDFSMLVMPDHYTPISLLTHSSEPVPFLMYSSKHKLGDNEIYNEETASLSGIYFEDSTELIKSFFSLA